MSEIDDKIKEINQKLRDPSIDRKAKRTLAKEGIPLVNKKMLNQE
jgi:hypothetical protein